MKMRRNKADYCTISGLMRENVSEALFRRHLKHKFVILRNKTHTPSSVCLVLAYRTLSQFHCSSWRISQVEVEQKNPKRLEPRISKQTANEQSKETGFHRQSSTLRYCVSGNARSTLDPMYDDGCPHASQTKVTEICALSELRFLCPHRKDVRSHREGPNTPSGVYQRKTTTIV